MQQFGQDPQDPRFSGYSDPAPAESPTDVPSEDPQEAVSTPSAAPSAPESAPEASVPDPAPEAATAPEEVPQATEGPEPTPEPTPEPPEAVTEPSSDLSPEPSQDDPQAPTANVGSRSVYLLPSGPPEAVEGEESQWTLAPVTTTDEEPKALYFYAGDVNPGDQSGNSVDGAQLYTGSTQ